MCFVTRLRPLGTALSQGLRIATTQSPLSAVLLCAKAHFVLLLNVVAYTPMSKRFIVYLLIAAILGTAFWYVRTEHVCPIPFTNRIGTNDEGFDITAPAALASLDAAEKAWE